MARITIMPNGVTASNPRQGPNPDPAKRGDCQGWTPQVTRRLKRWLYSVDGPALDGYGYALTNTVLELPPTPADWTATLKRYHRLLRGQGMIRGQWLTEFQKRQVPHGHGCAYFPEASPELPELLKDLWLTAAAPWGPHRDAQHVEPIYGLPGWFQYQARHSARGVKHIQRASVPKEWQGGTGRMWGVLGDWPTRELQINGVDLKTFHRLRRIVQRWLIADARTKQEGDWPRRVAWLRRMLQDPDPKRSAVRPIGEFCPESIARQLVIASLHDESSGSVEAEPPQGGA